MPDDQDRRKTERSERLPIKLILPHQGSEFRVEGGGAPPKPFRPVTAEYRRRISNQVRAVSQAIKSGAKSAGAVPIRAKLLKQASAKSHRPETLFSEGTCPIIGAGSLGELFLKATPEGLARIETLVEKSRSERVTKEISSIESIEPITPEYRLDGQTPSEVLRHSPRKSGGFVTRVQLFDFGLSKGQPNLIEDFEKACRDSNLRISRGGYSDALSTYEVTCRNVEDVGTLSKIVGVRSVKRMPIIRGVRGISLSSSPIPSNLPIPHTTLRDFPTVVVIDSGVTETIAALNQWVVGRESTVAPEYRNSEHGTFVAGLVCWAKELNPRLPGLDSNPCAVFDFQVIPNSNPDAGEIEFITESELLQALETALRQHANDYKVWNLSLGLDEVCSLDRFSPFAVELDNLQEKYKVSFVINAGNYDSIPMMDFPRSPEHLSKGRITSPADSVLGLAVGSISHFSHESNGPKENEPSAFSRHGAGPNYIIKPDLVHYGGTCKIDGTEYQGIRSLGVNGCAESVGTSYSTPMVSRLLANIYHQIAPTPSPVLARALLTHHARDPRTRGRVKDADENIFGFGLPVPLPYCIECTPFISTLVFEDTLRPGYNLEWNDFPYPDSLRRNGRYFGDLWMTVAFSPTRGPKWGTEYCETHITASLGVYSRQKSKTRKESLVFKGLVPPEHKQPGVLYESYQVSQLRKWAPVRTYFGALGPKGVRGERWRLFVRLLLRHEIENESTFKPQPFALIVTIADPNQTAPVYDEMARKILNRFQAQNLTLRAPVQVRARP